MASYRCFIKAIVFIAGLTSSKVYGAFHSKMSGVQNDISDITWAHAVNSWEFLEKALASPVDFLEADISLGHVVGYEDGPAVPVMAHPPDSTSDISLDSWLGLVLKRKSQKGLKLDFKSLEVVEPSLVILEKYASKLNSSVWLNADVLTGPVNSSATPVQVDTILALCHQYFPEATLSAGWTTQWFPTFTEDTWHYGWNHVRKMADVIRCRKYENNYPKFTFPVRGIFASRSIKQLQWLLSVIPDSTLTIWTGKFDPLDLQNLLRIRSSFENYQVYYDIPEKLNSVFKKEKNSANVPLDSLRADDDQWMILTRGQEESCSTVTYASNNCIVFGSTTTSVLYKNVILPKSNDLKVTGKIKFFNTENRPSSQSGKGMQELRIAFVDVSLFAKNASGESGNVIDLTVSDSEVIWSAIDSSTIYTLHHSYDKQDTSCQIFKLDTSEDKSFEVWTVPCDAMLEETSFEQLSEAGIPAVSSRKRLVVPPGPFMLGFVSVGDEHVVIYDLTINGHTESSTSGVKSSVVKTSFTALISILFILLVSVFT